MRWSYVLAIAGLVGAWHWWTHERPVARAPGELVSDSPHQRDLEAAPPFEVILPRSWSDAPPLVSEASAASSPMPSSTPRDASATRLRIHPRARYDLTVRVLRTEPYRLDGAAKLAPVDLAVGWRRMSDSAVLDQLSITQMGRFFYWRPKSSTFDLPAEALISEAAQIHAIPATREVDETLRHLRPGTLVRLEGYLVDVSGPGFRWNTSLSRTDTGDGACEIMWIESAEVR